jgi:hypothetical protein
MLFSNVDADDAHFKNLQACGGYQVPPPSVDTDCLSPCVVDGS